MKKVNRKTLLADLKKTFISGNRCLSKTKIRKQKGFIYPLSASVLGFADILYQEVDFKESSKWSLGKIVDGEFKKTIEGIKILIKPHENFTSGQEDLLTSIAKGHIIILD